MSGYEPSSAEVIVTLWMAKTLLSPYYARYVRGLGLTGNERVLDYGSGPGVAARYIARTLAKIGGRLTCVDVSQAWLRVAQKTLRRYANVDYKLGDIWALDIENDAYDTVFVHFVLHEVPAAQRPQAAQHLARALRPGGRLVLREPTEAGHGIAPQEIRLLMAEAGLQEVCIKTGKALLIQPVCDGIFQKPTTPLDHRTKRRRQ